jgi:hypothetical protein
LPVSFIIAAIVIPAGDFCLSGAMMAAVDALWSSLAALCIEASAFLKTLASQSSREDSYMRNIIITMIFLLTLVGANGIVAQTAKADDNHLVPEPLLEIQSSLLRELQIEV